MTQPPQRPGIRQCAEDHAASTEPDLGVPLLAPTRTVSTWDDQRDERKNDPHLCYSLRSVSTGFTRAARLAGTTAATERTLKRSAVDPPNATADIGEAP